MKDNSTISQELLETVERYHQNTMTKAERLTFEAKLQTDAEFKILVTDIQSLFHGIEQQSLKEKLDEFHKDLPIQLETESTDTKLRFLHIRKIVTAAIVVIALGGFWFFNGSSNERLYANYFSPDPGLPTTMGSSDNFAFYDAMVNYKQGDYDKAIAKWEMLQTKEPQNDTLNYFLGVANLAENNTEKALSFLKQTVSNQNSVFTADANYYIGLAYLKKDDNENAVKYLKLSSTENSKNLLEKLD